MQQPAWWIETKRLLYFMTIAIAVGFLLGEVLISLVVSLLSFAVSVIVQFRRLEQWFGDNVREVPEATGAWGRILDKVYIIQRKGNKARSELQAIIDRSRASINAFHQGVLLVDQNSSLDWWNKAAGKMLGLYFPQDISQPIGNLIRAPNFRDYFARKSYEEPLIIYGPDNKTRLQMQFTLFGQDERLIVISDISHVAHLEQVRSDFVSNVSHELKTPLTVLRGYLETFVDQLPKFEPRLQRPIKSMAEQAVRMDALVEDLLLLSKLESRDHLLNESSIDLAELAKGVIEACQFLAEQKNQTMKLEMSAPISIVGAYNEVRSALLNLAVNAVKYTGENGKILIRVCRDYSNLDMPSGASLIVEDNGVGIDDQHISRLTERFYRVDQGRSKDTGGTGLGLAIVKHVLIRHQGVLDVESELNKGSRFICKFPEGRVAVSEDRSLVQGSEIKCHI